MKSRKCRRGRKGAGCSASVGLQLCGEVGGRWLQATRIFRRDYLLQKSNLTLSVDHRVIDGAIGAKFLNEIASFIEEPINLIV